MSGSWRVVCAGSAAWTRPASRANASIVATLLKQPPLTFSTCGLARKPTLKVSPLLAYLQISVQGQRHGGNERHVNRPGCHHHRDRNGRHDRNIPRSECRYESNNEPG